MHQSGVVAKSRRDLSQSLLRMETFSPGEMAFGDRTGTKSRWTHFLSRKANKNLVSKANTGKLFNKWSSM